MGGPLAPAPAGMGGAHSAVVGARDRESWGWGARGGVIPDPHPSSRQAQMELVNSVIASSGDGWGAGGGCMSPAPGCCCPAAPHPRPRPLISAGAITAPGQSEQTRVGGQWLGAGGARWQFGGPGQIRPQGCVLPLPLAAMGGAPALQAKPTIALVLPWLNAISP